MESVNIPHAVTVGVVTTGVAKAFSMFNGTNVPFMIQAEGGLIAGVSTVVTDSFMGKQSSFVKAAVTGGVLAGTMMAWKSDNNWMIWGAVGAGSYLLSDQVQKYYKSMPKSTSNAPAAGHKKGKPLPEVAGL